MKINISFCKKSVCLQRASRVKLQYLFNAKVPKSKKRQLKVHDITPEVESYTRPCPSIFMYIFYLNFKKKAKSRIKSCLNATPRVEKKKHVNQLSYTRHLRISSENVLDRLSVLRTIELNVILNNLREQLEVFKRQE